MVAEESLVRLTDQIYEAAVDPRAWPAFLGELRAALRAAAVNLHIRVHDGDTRVVKFTSGGFDEALQPTYRERFFRFDPWVRTLWFPEGSITPSTSLIDNRSLQRTDYYNDYLRPQGFLDGIVATISRFDGSTGAAFGIHRPECDAERLRLLRELLPHARRAFKITLRVLGREGERASLAAVLDRLELAAMRIDSEGRVRWTNASAASLLDRKDGLELDGRGLRPTDPASVTVFRGLLAAAGVRPGAAGLVRAGALRLPRGFGRSSLLAFVVPARGAAQEAAGDRAAVLIIVLDPERGSVPAPGILAGLYGLSPAEVRLALAICRGLAPKEAARELGISCATARCQLRAVFRKTDTDGQPALARLLSTLALLPRV